MARAENDSRGDTAGPVRQADTGSLLLRFRNANVRLSRRFLPASLWQSRGFAIYDWVVRSLLGEDKVKTVVDVGGGRSWHFGDGYRSRPGFRLIGIDVSGEELALNPSLDEAFVADICKEIPLPDASVDLLLCRATVEHLADTGAFLAHAYRVLKPGGRAALVYANPWAPPMILNRMLPNWVASRLLEGLVPGAKGYQGFRAYYDKCTYAAFEREALRLGFQVKYGYCSYYSSSYFEFFTPLHILSVIGDGIRAGLGIKLFSAMNLFVLERPVNEDGPAASRYVLVPTWTAAPNRRGSGFDD